MNRQPRNESQGNHNNQRGPIAWMARNSVTSNLLMLVFIIGGLLVSLQLRQEVYPDFQLNTVRIKVNYSGATPQEMEQSVVLPIENAIAGIEGIKQINARAAGSFATVIVELINNADVDQVQKEIERAVDRVRLPTEAEEPLIERQGRRYEVIELMLYGNTDPVALRETATLLRDTLLRSSTGLTQVELDLAPKYEIQVAVAQEQLQRYDLSLETLSRRITDHAINQSGGKLETAGGDLLITLDNRKEWASDFKDIPIIASDDGFQLPLGELASVTDGFNERKTTFFYNGQPALSIKVYRVADQTPAGVSAAVHEQMPVLQSLLQPGMSLDVVTDDAVIFQQRMGLLLKNAFSGLVIVLVVLALFLDLRLAFWVTMGIPTAFLGTLLFLPVMDISINMISMFAFIIALGIVVDDAIIAGENIYEHMNQGMPFAQAAVIGVQDIAVPLTFSILTNIVAFLPILLMPGTLGLTFRVIPFVVATVFIISWVEALFILPAHLASLREGEPRGLFYYAAALRSWVTRGLNHFVDNGYAPLLAMLLKQRYLVAATGLTLLMISLSYLLGGHLGFSTMPRVEADVATARAILPLGTSIADASLVRQQLEQSALALREAHGGTALVKGISSFQRNQDGEFTIIVRLFLQPAELREMSTREVSSRWRRLTGTIPGVEGIRFSSSGSGPGADVAGVTVELRHHDNRILEQASEEMSGRMGDYAGVVDIVNTFATGSQQLALELLPTGKAMGLDEKELARQVRSAFNGVRAIRQQRGSEEVDVQVSLPESQRTSEYHLERLMIRVGKEHVPLMQVAAIKRENAAAIIQRRAGQRRVLVTADVTPASHAMMLSQTLADEVFPDLRERYPGLNIGFRGDQIEQQESMGSLLTGSLLVLLALYCLLAIPFKSYTQPLIIMIIIPYGLIGAVAGHILLGYSMSVVSLLGALALSGVVINDSLLIVTETNRQKSTGLDTVSALVAACRRRFRPIILTTLTTFGGLAPMILEPSRQAALMIPMAISLGFGIVFATAITLLLLPSLYLILDDIKGAFCPCYPPCADNKPLQQQACVYASKQE